jgi:nicotinate-nucleotide adenylyltransferase
MTQKLGILGGTFNPVHHGHLILAQDALEHFGLDRVLLIPCAQPPHKRPEQLAPETHRVAMLRVAIGDDPRFEVSTLELERQGPSYTIETIKALHTELTDAKLHFIIGTDSLLELYQWYMIGQLLELCEFVTMLRPGFPVEHLTEERLNLPARWGGRLLANLFPGHAADISSTDIRQRVAAGRSIRYLVPAAVARYIATEGLYRE